MAMSLFPLPISPWRQSVPARITREVSRMSDASIICSGLSFSWPDDTPVLHDVSFTVGSGRTGLVAPNGSGRSTLFTLIAGRLRPTARSVTVGGTLGCLPRNGTGAPQG